MSDSSRDYDSSGSLKGFKNRLQSKSNFDATDGIKKGLNHLSGFKKNLESTFQNMFTGKGEGSVYSKGTRELDDFGYEKYNLDDDCGEIFISKVPEKAMFNDGEPILVRATDGNVVSTSNSRPMGVDIMTEPVSDPVCEMFTNVPRGSAMDAEYRATMGVVTPEGELRPTPANDFLKKMRGSGNDRATGDSKSVDPLAEALEATPANESEAPMFIQIDDDEGAPAAEVPEIEVPAEDTYSFMKRLSRTTGEVEKPRSHIEFIIDPDEAEAPAEEASTETPAEDDDLSWLDLEGETEEVSVDVPEEVPEIEVPAEISVEEHVDIHVADEDDMLIETLDEASKVEVQTEVTVEADDVAVEPEMPVEAPVDIVEEVVEVPEEIPVEAAEEVQTEVTVEPAVVEEVFVDVPVDIPAEAPAEAAEEVQNKAPAEAVVMTLPSIDISAETIDGLDVEGSEPSSCSEIAEGINATPEAVQEALTSATVEAPRCSGLARDGEALPPLSDPVVKRPRSVRFRFSNGVLQNVDSDSSSKEGLQEGPRDPLE